MKNLLKTKLNTKSYYNFLESFLSIDDIILYAINNQLNHACLLDKNMHGVIEFYDKCKQNNLKPIVGLEVENYRNHKIYLIAKNYQGYLLLAKISSFIELEKDINQIEFNNDDVFVITHEFYENINSDYVINDFNSNKQITFLSAYGINKEDNDSLIILDAIKNEKNVSEFEIKNPINNPMYLENNAFEFNDIALNNLQTLIDNINLEIPKNEKHFIDFKVDNKKEYFWNLVINKLKALNKYNDVYLERLKYEFDLIVSKGFVDYFLVVSDFVNFARNNHIEIGPGRGSAPGSLISYLLDITKIDPIENGLLFERFLNSARMTMPDIDIDVMDLKRDKLIQYIINKYGEYNVSYIITFSRYKLKMALRDIGRILGLPISLIDKISKKIDSDNQNSINDLIINNPELNEIYLENKMLFDLAQKLIGMPRQYSIHAAGIILSDKPIYEIAPIVKNSDNRIIVQYSMEHLEDLGLIKIDLLGLKNLTIIKQIVDLIEKTRNEKIDLYNLDLNDKMVFSILTKGETNGIFQFESPGMRNLLMQIKPKNLEDLSITSAIFRPGASSHIKTFIKNKNNNNITYLHEDLKEILEPTYGAIIYQEQIINIVKKFAKFDQTESDLFRKAISKKDESKINQLKDKFINNCINNGYSKFVAEKIFNFMEEFASYGFNHSHSLSYALISYQLAYLKAHYPLETITILLDSTDKSKISIYKQEASRYNINFLAPNINISTSNFLLFKNNIYFSFDSINGISYETVKKILNVRNNQPDKKFNDIFKTISMLHNNGISKRNIESLIKVGCFDDLEKRRNFLLTNIDEIINKNASIDLNGKQLFDLNLIDNVIENKDDYLKWENELMGFSITVSEYQELFNHLSTKYDLDQAILKDKNNLVLIYVKDTELKTNNKKEEMLLINTLIDNKEKKVYCFDKELKSLDSGYYVANLKTFAKSKSDNLILEKIIERVNYES